MKETAAKEMLLYSTTPAATFKVVKAAMRLIGFEAETQASWVKTRSVLGPIMKAVLDYDPSSAAPTPEQLRGIKAALLDVTDKQLLKESSLGMPLRLFVANAKKAAKAAKALADAEATLKAAEEAKAAEAAADAPAEEEAPAPAE
mmetsp:Transcript_25275/g.83006  ORF Transcript_25275/g.83006 Transcript_25275/m.83006 type:complete len:145 (-) Transcript_25275:60-494(-)